MKKVISVLLLIAIALSVCACSGSNARERYIGTWSDETGNVVLVVASNSKVTLKMGDKLFTGTWVLETTDATPEEDVGMLTNKVENLKITFDTPLVETVVEETVPAETTEETVPAETTEETVPAETTEETVPAETTGETVPAETTGETVPAETTGETAPVETTPVETKPVETKPVVNFTYRVISGIVSLVTEELPGSSYYLLERTK